MLSALLRLFIFLLLYVILGPLFAASRLNLDKFWVAISSNQPLDVYVKLWKKALANVFGNAFDYLELNVNDPPIMDAILDFFIFSTLSEPIRDLVLLLLSLLKSILLITWSFILSLFKSDTQPAFTNNAHLQSAAQANYDTGHRQNKSEIANYQSEPEIANCESKPEIVSPEPKSNCRQTRRRYKPENNCSLGNINATAANAKQKESRILHKSAEDQIRADLNSGGYKVHIDDEEYNNLVSNYKHDLQTDTKFMYEEIDRLMAAGLIENSDATFGCRPFTLSKEANSNQLIFGVNYRPINDITEKMKVKYRGWDDISSNIRGIIFSRIKLRDVHHQMKIHPDSEKFTTFSTPRGNYKFKFFPAGLSDSMSYFDYHVHSVISSYPELPCINSYMGDIILSSDDIDAHTKQLEFLLALLQHNRFTVDVSQCHFATDSVDWHGHVVTAEGIVPLREKLDSYRQISRPKNESELRSFLGKVGYYQHAIPDYAHIEAPLRKLLRPEFGFRWSEAEVAAFNKIKRIEPVVLKSYSKASNKRLILEVKVKNRDTLLSATLSQVEDDGEFYPIHYYSHRFFKGDEVTTAKVNKIVNEKFSYWSGDRLERYVDYGTL